MLGATRPTAGPSTLGHAAAQGEICTSVRTKNGIRPALGPDRVANVVYIAGPVFLGQALARALTFTIRWRTTNCRRKPRTPRAAAPCRHEGL